MPNTGMIRNQGFKHEIYERKLKELQCSNKTLEFPKIGCTVKRNEPLYSRYTKRRPSQKRSIAETEEIYRHQYRISAQAQERSMILQQVVPDGSKTLQRNKLAPFSTLGKAYCGFNFSRETDNKKKKFGIMPSNLVKWRSDKVQKIADVS